MDGFTLTEINIRYFNTNTDVVIGCLQPCKCFLTAEIIALPQIYIVVSSSCGVYFGVQKKRFLECSYVYWHVVIY